MRVRTMRVLGGLAAGVLIVAGLAEAGGAAYAAGPERRLGEGDSGSRHVLAQYRWQCQRVVGLLPVPRVLRGRR